MCVPGARSTAPGVFAAPAVSSSTATDLPKLLLWAPCTTSSCCLLPAVLELLSAAAGDAKINEHAEGTFTMNVPDGACICCCCEGPSDCSKGHAAHCPSTDPSWATVSNNNNALIMSTAHWNAGGSAAAGRTHELHMRHCRYVVPDQQYRKLKQHSERKQRSHGHTSNKCATAVATHSSSLVFAPAAAVRTHLTAQPDR